MLDLPRRVLRMELPIVEHLVRTNKQTNKQTKSRKTKQNVNKAKTNKTKQSLHHQTTSYFCELTVKNRSSRLAFKIQEKITEKKLMPLVCQCSVASGANVFRGKKQTQF